MTYTSLFGAFQSRHDVQQAIITTLQEWILDYLAEVERQEGLNPRELVPPGAAWPPVADSFRGGLDFEAWQSDQLPILIVVCQPTGEPERIARGQYQQWYEIQVGAVIQDSDEEAPAVLLADRYGKALMGLLTEQGAFGTRVDTDGSTIPFAEKTVLTGAPHTLFPYPEKRNIALSITTVHTLIDQIVDESQGPRVPAADPYADPGNWPTITQIDIGLQTQDPNGQTSAGTGVAVTDSAGHVTVTE